MNLSWQLVLFEVLNFCALMAILARFLYRPVREKLEERRAQLEGARREVEAREREAAEVKAQFAARLAALEQEAADLRAAGRRRGADEAERLIDEAREDARRERERFQETLARSERLAFEGAREQVLRLAVEGAARALDGLGLPDLATAYARLGSQRLAQELGARQAGEPVQVQLSPDAEPEAIRAVLEQVLGPRPMELSADPELTGGVRLRLGDLQVEASAGATLGAWLERAGREGASPR
ncbi:MAG: ATP synthase F0 subunit B [Planctomycetota bacterium]